MTAGAALREPLTIADAARRAGVHPNTIRRLIRQGRVAARMVRGRYGDTWLVESADIDRAVGAQFQAGGASPDATAPGRQAPWSGQIDSPDFLPSGTDLSLDRARALERYTHGLLQPLVDLLREREAALESRDELIRAQAERIGRLERELELVKEAPPTPIVSVAPPSEKATEDLPAHVSSLASQVGRLRAELQLIATAFQPDADEGPPSSEPLSAVAEAAQSPLVGRAEPAQVPVVSEVTEEPASPAVTAEELASLFPATSRGRLTLRPLEDGHAGGHNNLESPEESTAGAATATPPSHPSTDPFAQAEAAVQELRRALAPDGLPCAVPSTPAAEAQPPSAAAPPTAPESRARRWWWPW